MNNPILDTFGEFLARKVRDKTIGDWERIIGGQMKGKTAEQVREELATFSPTQREALQKLIPLIVDSTLHHFLYNIEQENKIKIIISETPNNVQDLKVLSDGLAGELYGNNGWIARFSSKTKGKK